MAPGVEPAAREECPRVVGVEGDVGGPVDVRIWVLDLGVCLPPVVVGQPERGRPQGFIDSLLKTHANLDTFQARGASKAASKQTSC
jgi:hypothetical protein